LPQARDFLPDYSENLQKEQQPDYSHLNSGNGNGPVDAIHVSLDLWFGLFDGGCQSSARKKGIDFVVLLFGID
jgi:hypothetical protein